MKWVSVGGGLGVAAWDQSLGGDLAVAVDLMAGYGNDYVTVPYHAASWKADSDL